MRYGIVTFMLMLSCQTALGDAVAAKLYQALCMLHGRKFAGGLPTKLVVGPFKAPSHIPCQWLKNAYLIKLAADKLDITRGNSANFRNSSDLGFFQIQGTTRRPDLFQITSPNCDSTQDAACRWLFADGRSRPV